MKTQEKKAHKRKILPFWHGLSQNRLSLQSFYAKTPLANFLLVYSKRLLKTP